MNYETLAETPQFTVVNAYERDGAVGSGAYETEAQMEQRFIQTLEGQGYEYLKTLTTEAALVANLRRQMERLNHVALKEGAFTEGEWRRFYETVLANKKDHIVEKTRKFQEVRRFEFVRENTGEHINLMIVDAEHVNNNSLQVINQYREREGAKSVRYDVTILFNGLPVVHVELKRRGVKLREAFNQIKRYNREGFWGGDALFEWAQIFVISNGTETKYYANTTRDCHIREMAYAKKTGGKKQTSNSFEFTSFWADARNRTITDIRDFVRTFFAQQTLRNILVRFCVLTEENVLMVMRPYQIAATERILERIQMATNRPSLLGTVDAGGYVWHSTGSGKTLTSFKTAQLATGLREVDRVLFVVDRQDLDNQTQREYNKFQKDCVKGMASTEALRAQLSDKTKDSKGVLIDKKKIVITTIQKLSNFVSSTPPGSEDAGIYQKRVVIIFDECHRSQFGKMHAQIVARFKRYQIFGFTGTPIFPACAGAGLGARTTEQVFGKRLHQYTIVDAIRDGNVLPFHVETIGSVAPKAAMEDKDVRSIDTEKALLKPERVTKIVRHILDHFADKTLRSKTYKFKGEDVRGFNSIFCVSSVKAAQAFYEEFKKQLAALDDAHSAKGLRVATIFSCGMGEEKDDDDEFEAKDASALEFLREAVKDYNTLFASEGKTAFGVDGAEAFHNYYMDVSDKMKTRRIDLLIVVNMFLTGFDATTLNTLWVDKQLRQHGLLQAFSRTNRILNSVKRCGNIVCFRNLENETNEAIALFGDKDACGIVKIRTFDEYYNTGYTDLSGRKVKGYVELVALLKEKFPPGTPITGEENEKEFVALFGEVLRRMNLLRVFIEYSDDEDAKRILKEIEVQDYQSLYVKIYDKKRPKDRGEDIDDDIEFEMETIRQFDVGIDYILHMVELYHEGSCKDKDLLGKIMRALNASMELRPKRKLIEDFVNSYMATDAKADFASFVLMRFEQDIKDVSAKYGMNEKTVHDYMANALSLGTLVTVGEDFTKVLPRMPLFGGKEVAAAFEAKKATIISDLQALFNRYLGVYVDVLEACQATPAELWKSGKVGIPTVLPAGPCAYLTMEAEPYEAIELGGKRVEVREICEYYIPRFRDKKPVAVRLQHGYTKRQMVWEVEKIVEEGGAFKIHLGKRLR